MGETKSVVINGVTVMKGDIVKIKFRKLEEVLQDKRSQARVSDILSFYDIDDHMTTFLQGGGHFKVTDVSGIDGYLQLNQNHSPHNVTRKNAGPLDVMPEICVSDYNNDSNWFLNEIVIEEISVANDVAESYFSERHQISLVLIDSTLYLNGEPITSADSKIFQMFEKVMAEAAINNILNAELDDEKKDSIF